MSGLQKRRTWYLGMVLALAGSACHPDKKENATTIVGLVEGTSGGAAVATTTPIAGVEVSVVNLGLKTQTDASGRFEFKDLGAADHAFLEARASGYAPAWQPVWPVAKKENTVLITLKARSPAQTISVPTAPGGTIRVDAGITSIIIGKDDLVVEGTSTPVTGNIDVSLVPYDPEIEGMILPAPLIMRDSGTGQVVPLYSYGMADISLAQNGQALNVAAGQTLTWIFNINANRRVYATTTAPPRAYTFNASPDVFLWEEYGSWSYNDVSGDFTAELPHLSPAPNVDYPPPTRACLNVDVLLPLAMEQIVPTIKVAGGSKQGRNACFDLGCPGAPISTDATVVILVNGNESSQTKSASLSCTYTGCGGSSCAYLRFDFCNVLSRGTTCNRESTTDCCDLGLTCDDSLCVGPTAQ